MSYQSRIYRNEMNIKRFRFFNIICKETDLWIGVSHSDYSINLVKYIEKQVINNRRILENYISENPDFQYSLSPVSVNHTVPEIIDLMLSSVTNASVGPMASVAGAVCEIIGNKILNKYAPHELIIENGGDIYVNVTDELLVQCFAGENKNFINLALSIPGNTGSLGICTSSGMFGHSFSFGKADAVTVVCRSAALADAWATSICNKILQKEDIKPILALYKKINNILSLVAVKDDEIGVSGQFPLKFVS